MEKENEVYCPFRQPDHKNGMVDPYRGLDSAHDAWLIGHSYFPWIQVFGFTGRACEILVFRHSDICVCPSLDYNWMTCPYGGETDKTSAKK